MAWQPEACWCGRPFPRLATFVRGPLTALMPYGSAMPTGSRNEAVQG